MKTPKFAPSELVAQVLMAVSRLGSAVWRSQVGLFWQGELVSKVGGNVTLRNARAVHVGVTGMSDTLGLTPVTITPEMVGKRVAVYTAIECKSGAGRLTKEQAAFLEMVRRSGGIAGVARTPDDVRALLSNPVFPDAEPTGAASQAVH